MALPILAKRQGLQPKMAITQVNCSQFLKYGNKTFAMVECK